MEFARSLLIAGAVSAMALPAFAGKLNSSIQVPASGKAESGKAAEAHEEINVFGK